MPHKRRYRYGYDDTSRECPLRGEIKGEYDRMRSYQNGIARRRKNNRSYDATYSNGNNNNNNNNIDNDIGNINQPASYDMISDCDAEVQLYAAAIDTGSGTTSLLWLIIIIIIIIIVCWALINVGPK